MIEAQPTPPESPPARPSRAARGTRTVTLTLPARLYDSLDLAAKQRGMGEDVPELMKNGLFLAYSSKEGWLLQLPKINVDPDPRQGELPLLAAAETTSAD